MAATQLHSLDVGMDVAAQACQAAIAAERGDRGRYVQPAGDNCQPAAVSSVQITEGELMQNPILSTFGFNA